jgi:hypothetical protein
MRDIDVAYGAQLDALDRDITGAQRDTDQYRAQLEAIYNAFGRQVQPLTGEYKTEMGDIKDTYTQDIAGLANLLGTSTPAGEMAAAAGLLGNIGGGGLNLLASQQARNVGYNTSALRQGEIESVVSQGNALQDLANYVTGVREEKRDIRGQMPEAALSRMEDIRDTMRQYGLAKKEFGLRNRALDAQILSDQALSDYYEQLLSQGSKAWKPKWKPKKKKGKGRNVPVISGGKDSPAPPPRNRNRGRT